jgi:hypothetical protein
MKKIVKSKRHPLHWALGSALMEVALQAESECSEYTDVSKTVLIDKVMQRLPNDGTDTLSEATLIVRKFIASGGSLRVFATRSAKTKEVLLSKSAVLISGSKLARVIG